MQANNNALKDDVIDIATDRFERRLSAEIGAVRVEMMNGFAALRQEMANGFIVVRKEISDSRVDFIKWSFLFWIGQIAVLSGVMALLLRGSAR